MWKLLQPPGQQESPIWRGKEMGQQYQQEQTAANATTGESIENRGEREKVENVAAAAAKDDVVINRLLL